MVHQRELGFAPTTHLPNNGNCANANASKRLLWAMLGQVLCNSLNLFKSHGYILEPIL